MNPIIEALLLQITLRCLQITAQGQWHAFVHISAHVRQISIRIHPADSRYSPPEAQILTFDQSAYYAADPRYNSEWNTGKEEAAEKALQALLSELEPFLLADKQEAVA